MKLILIALILTLIMGGTAIADGDQVYGMMGSECAECTDIPWCQEELFNDAITAFDIAITAIPVLEEWEYGRRNMCQDGIEYAYWGFEEGRNLYPLRNEHPGVATFENVSNSRCCYPACDDNNEPSYVRKGAGSGPNCRCIMHIYPYNTQFSNGTEMPYISALTGNAAFSPRVLVSSWCYYPACSARIVFKEDTQFVSFLASTHGNLRVVLYDPKGSLLSRSYIPVNTKREGDSPPNFTRFVIHLPNQEIGSMELSGPFNGWNIDEMIIGGEPGYLPEKPVDYTYVADLAEELHGVWWCEHALGFDYEDFTYAEPFQFNEYLEYWDPEDKVFKDDQGISNPGLIFWAYNKDSNDLAGIAFVKQITPAKMMKHDFKVDVDPAATQPGDVYFMDYCNKDGVLGQDGVADFVGMVVTETPTEMNLIASQPDLANDPIGVIYSKKSIVEGSPAFMGYKRLPGVIRGGKNPVPKGH